MMSRSLSADLRVERVMTEFVRASVRSGSAPLSPHEVAVCEHNEGVSNEAFLDSEVGLMLRLIEGRTVAASNDFV
jgi:hypothetical protein